ncbi:myeloblastin-like [Clupea harengus]|uniref:trypsin n=1 Tax=Clupea harengus TaxID=7950 RepID=A0A8M1KDA3_CLUHA|nr:myeloblastin-like [Clupea harengus]
MLVFLLLSNLSFSGAVQSGIFGGREAKPHSRPYMASLQTGGHHVCGGVLIRQDYVLTAAHCLNDRPTEVLLGAHNISMKEGSQQRVKIAAIHKNPLHLNPKEHLYDIMLVKLATKARVNGKVQVLDLPAEGAKGLECSVAGWGMAAPKSSAQSVLQEAAVQLDDPSQCRCVFGDSGGPLVCQSKLYGIVAYTATRCNSYRYPQVYMNVSFFLPWIREVLEGSA